MQFTPVTSLKTASFKNDFGEFSYRSVKPELMFGYGVEHVSDGLPVNVATPAKALCDFLYLNSQYDTPEDIEEQRLDADVLEEISRDSALAGVADRSCPRYGLIVTFELTIVIDFCSTVAGADCATATVENVPKLDQQLIGLLCARSRSSSLSSSAILAAVIFAWRLLTGFGASR